VNFQRENEQAVISCMQFLQEQPQNLDTVSPLFSSCNVIALVLLSNVEM